MARSLTQAASIYSVSLLLILIGYTPHNLLQACPLPANASCTECQLLRYIQLNRSRQLNISLNVAIDLALSQNTADNFQETINSDDRHDSISFELNQRDSVESCLLVDDPNAGSPCTHDFQKTGAGLSCKWNYTCDYNPNRFPQYLWKAECMGSAHPIFYQIPTLTLENKSGSDCLPFTGTQTVYKWGLEKVAVACSCTDS